MGMLVKLAVPDVLAGTYFLLVVMHAVYLLALCVALVSPFVKFAVVGALARLVVPFTAGLLPLLQACPGVSKPVARLGVVATLLWRE